MIKNDAVWAVIEELEKAMQSHGVFNSPHEAYAVLLEEVDELWETIKFNCPPKEMQKEAIQVAAMALRFLIDCT